MESKETNKFEVVLKNKSVYFNADGSIEGLRQLKTKNPKNESGT